MPQILLETRTGPTLVLLQITKNVYKACKVDREKQELSNRSILYVLFDSTDSRLPRISPRPARASPEVQSSHCNPQSTLGEFIHSPSLANQSPRYKRPMQYTNSKKRGGKRAQDLNNYSENREHYFYTGVGKARPRQISHSSGSPL